MDEKETLWWNIPFGIIFWIIIISISKMPKPTNSEQQEFQDYTKYIE